MIVTRKDSSEVEYEIWLGQPNGTPIMLLEEVISFGGVRAVNNVGYWSVNLPYDFPRKFLKEDNIVEIWRKAPGGVKSRFISGFIRREVSNSDEVMISGPDLNYLLDGRIVAYAAGSAEAEQTDYADDMMKVIVDQNLGASATDSDRDLSAFLSTAAQVGLGPSITKSFAWRNVLRTLQDIAASARQAGTAVYFDIVWNGTSALQFRTFIDQPGVDNTYPSGQDPVIFGKEFGNLEDPLLEKNYLQERTYVYAGGPGEEDNREIVEAEDTDRSGLSIWNRKEIFRDARNEETTAGVTAAANAELEDGRPRKRFQGTLLDTEQTRFGKDWNFGDRVTVTFAGEQFDGLVKSVALSVNGNKEEELKGGFEL